MSTQTTTGEEAGEEEAEETPGAITQHIEIPKSTEYSIDIKRKQNNDKIFLNLRLRGEKGRLNHSVNIEYADCNMKVSELVNQTIQSLMSFQTHYHLAQEAILEQTNVTEFFTP